MLAASIDCFAALPLAGYRAPRAAVRRDRRGLKGPYGERQSDAPITSQRGGRVPHDAPAAPGARAALPLPSASRPPTPDRAPQCGHCGVLPDVALKACPELAKVVPQAGQRGPFARAWRRSGGSGRGNTAQVIEQAMRRAMGDWRVLNSHVGGVTSMHGERWNPHHRRLRHYPAASRPSVRVYVCTGSVTEPVPQMG